jgi:hypothetical protein
MSSSRAAVTALVLGTLSVAAIPLGVAAAVFFSTVEVLRATVIAVPAGGVVGLAGVSATRRARYRFERSVKQRGARAIRLGRFLVWSGLYLAVIGGLALGFYGLLRAFS